MPSDTNDRIVAELFKVASVLASDQGTLEERLANAYFSHIEALDVTSLPSDAQLQFNWIRAQLSKMFPAPGVVDGVSRGVAVLVAQNLILLHYSLKWRNDNNALNIPLDN